MGGSGLVRCSIFDWSIWGDVGAVTGSEFLEVWGFVIPDFWGGGCGLFSSGGLFLWLWDVTEALGSVSDGSVVLGLVSFHLADRGEFDDFSELVIPDFRDIFDDPGSSCGSCLWL